MSIRTTEGTDPAADVAQPISIEVIYARPGSIWRQSLQLTSACTVQQALILSGFFDDFPECQLATIKVGIYGQQCALDRVVLDKERIEIYRPLVFDPMESRRRRARHRQRTKQEDKMSRI